MEEINRGAAKSLIDNSNYHYESDLGEELDFKPIYCRVLGYGVGGAIHLGNILAMALALRGPIMEDPDIKLFYSMEFFYCTIWNLVFQLLYLGMGLACDLPILLKLKNIEMLNHLRSYRKIFYSGLLWPVGLGIFILYWPIYAYDRNLIFPDYIDKVLGKVSNYIMHMFIVLPILWDLFFLPFERPPSIKYSLGHCVLVVIVYYIAIFALYGVRGVWPYPILKEIYDTFYFPLLFIFVAILLLAIYFVQWPIRSRIWRKHSNGKRTFSFIRP